MNTFKKIVAAAAAAAMAATSATAVFAQTYKDVPTTHWAYNAVERCTAANWFAGYPDGSFHPDDSIKRSEAAKVFVEFNSIPVSAVTSTEFSDLDLTAWYAPYVEAGKSLFPEKTEPATGKKVFKAEFTITREDTIYALVKALRYDKYVEFADLSVLNMFSDQNSISAAVKPYVAVAVKYGLASGYDNGTIGGQDPLTRAQFATLLYRGTMLGVLEDTGSNKIVSGVSVEPATMQTLTIGESFDLTAVLSYSDGSTESYTEKLAPYSDNGTSVVTINRNKVTAVGEGTAIVKFNNDELKDKELVIIVNKPADAPTITLNSYDASTEEETAVLTGTVTDPTGTALTLTVNGQAVGINADGSFTASVNLAVGANSIAFSAKNAYGNEAVQTAAIERTAAATPAPTLAPLPTAKPVSAVTSAAPDPTADPDPDPDPAAVE